MEQERNFSSANETVRDPQLWKIAQARTSFKTHFTIYLIMSVVFWVIWYFTGGPAYNNNLPWPVWPMAGWGLGVFFHYMGAYVWTKNDGVQREYNKLVQQHNKQ